MAMEMLVLLKLVESRQPLDKLYSLNFRKKYLFVKVL